MCWFSAVKMSCGLTSRQGSGPAWKPDLVAELWGVGDARAALCLELEVHALMSSAIPITNGTITVRIFNFADRPSVLVNRAGTRGAGPSGPAPLVLLSRRAIHS